MKQILEELNQYLLDLQCEGLNQDDSDTVWSYIYFDKLSFTEFRGLFDITWFAGNYGTSTWPIEDVERYQPGNLRQHCDCENDDQESCECELDEVSLSWFMDVLIAHPEKIRSLIFTGTDSGANGLRNWDFSRLLDSDVMFPNLAEFKVQLHEVGNHNLNLIGDYDDDHAQVTALLAKMPNVASVELPTPPDEKFFNMKFPKLRQLKIQSGHDSKRFVRNLASSPLLANISLDFTDVWSDDELSYGNSKDNIADAEDPKIRKAKDRQELKEAGCNDAAIALALDNLNRDETLRLLNEVHDDPEDINDAMKQYSSMGKWDENGEVFPENNDLGFAMGLGGTYQARTSFEDYKSLFQSKYIRNGMHFKLRENFLTEKELFALQLLNKRIQFLHIPTSDCYYVSHKLQDRDEWL